jgi:hypothetical protein
MNIGACGVSSTENRDPFSDQPDAGKAERTILQNPVTMFGRGEIPYR